MNCAKKEPTEDVVAQHLGQTESSSRDRRRGSEVREQT